MPGLEQMMDPFPLNQGARENRPENRWPQSWLEPPHVHAARQIIQFLLREPLDAECVGGLLGKNEEQVRQVVLFEETLSRLQKILLPAPALRGCRTRSTIANDFSPVPMP